ncbi:MAG TPA: patatin-like phospholipase family protein [Schlesneria sp.]|jgi:NTE family protein
MAKVHVFRSQNRVFGFTVDEQGTNLPLQYSPWTSFKTVELYHDEPYQGVDVTACLDDISKHGFHLTAAHKRITHLAVVKERALVLGGGGAAGNAWLIGIIAGLFEAGLDVTETNLVIGTSAGSTAAAQITSETPTQLLANIFSAAPAHRTGTAGDGDGRAPVSPVPDHLDRTNRIIAASQDASDMRRKLGAATLEMDGASDNSVQKQWRATVAARLPKQEWPQHTMLIPAVDADTGEPVVFNRYSGVDLVDAVAASCAGGFAYSIGDKRYIDGAYRADVNADLAAGYRRVLILAPLGDRTRKRLEWGLHLTAQVEELRARGSRVETVFPDGDSKNALGVGMNLMDLSARQPSAQAGYNQGKAIAEELAEFWC